ncbi:hypothetical protein MMC09_005670 [Bachmanniomyces sp. S44760]|nr:hypothetical protein [Bachmanniomyces sp. S44760]
MGTLESQFARYPGVMEDAQDLHTELPPSTCLPPMLDYHIENAMNGSLRGSIITFPDAETVQRFIAYLKDKTQCRGFTSSQKHSIRAHYKVLNGNSIDDDEPKRSILVDKTTGRRIAVREKFHKILVWAHIQTEHGGRDQMCRLIKRHYAFGLSNSMILEWKRRCPHCQAIGPRRRRRPQQPYDNQATLTHLDDLAQDLPVHAGPAAIEHPPGPAHPQHPEQEADNATEAAEYIDPHQTIVDSGGQTEQVFPPSLPPPTPPQGPFDNNNAWVPLPFTNDLLAAATAAAPHVPVQTPDPFAFQPRGQPPNTTTTYTSSTLSPDFNAFASAEWAQMNAAQQELTPPHSSSSSTMGFRPGCGPGCENGCGLGVDSAATAPVDNNGVENRVVDRFDPMFLDPAFLGLDEHFLAAFERGRLVG